MGSQQQNDPAIVPDEASTGEMIFSAAAATARDRRTPGGFTVG
jgi:hypothetical protein